MDKEMMNGGSARLCEIAREQAIKNVDVPRYARKSWVVWDIDGTLADVSWRVEHVQRGLDPRPDGQSHWDVFHQGIPHDLPCEDMRILHYMTSLWSNSHYPVRVAVLTGRPEKYRQDTINWMEQHQIKADLLMMRPEGDYSSDGKFKVAQMAISGLLPETVLSVFEDRQAVVDALRAVGYRVLQVQAGEY